MKRLQVGLLTSHLPAGRRVLAAGLTGALGLLASLIVSAGTPATLLAASPDTSLKHVGIPQIDPASRAKVAQQYGHLPLSFEPNRGQTDSQVNFLSRGRGYQIFLTPAETVLSLRKSAARSRQTRRPQAAHLPATSCA